MNDSVASLVQLLHHTSDEMKRLADPSLTFGQSMEVDGIKVVPVFKASFGIAGGGAQTKNDKWNGGAGGKAELSPVAFLVFQDGQVQVVPAEAPQASGISAAVREVIATVLDRLRQKKATAQEES